MATPSNPEMLAMYYEAETLRMLSIMDEDGVAPAFLDEKDGMLYVNASLIQAIMGRMVEDTQQYIAPEEFKIAIHLSALVAVDAIQQAFVQTQGINIDELDTGPESLDK
mgnify:CR=1 FL=1